MASSPVVQCLHRPTAFAVRLAILLGITAPALAQTLPSGGAVPTAPIGGPADSNVVPAVAKFEELVTDVQIRGNKQWTREKLLSHVRTRPGRPFDQTIIEEDVRRLNRSRLCVNVKPYTQRLQGGWLVVFEVDERPTLSEVRIIGPNKIRPSSLMKEIKLQSGDAMDPFAVEEGRRKIEEYYHKHGFPKARVTIFEGDRVGDRRAIFVVNEGPKQKVLWVSFVGNTIATDARLRTVIQSKPPIAYLFKGDVDRDQIEEDVERLTAYYRDLGYMLAKVGRELQYNASQEWLTLSFVIYEGPRAKVRNISIVGNAKISTEELMAESKLQRDEWLSLPKLKSDAMRVQERYGRIGYVFADVKHEIKFLDDPNYVDLVYNLSEGARYSVGKIDVMVGGENPHTARTAVLNQLSFKTGEIVDIRKLKDSERRLRASQLFLVDPASGSMPKIVYTPPTDAEDVQYASRKGRFRGQSPDGAEPPPRPLSITVFGEPAAPAAPPAMTPLPELHNIYPQPEAAAFPFSSPRRSVYDRSSMLPPPAGLLGAKPETLVVRGQYTTDLQPGTSSSRNRWLPGFSRSRTSTPSTAPATDQGSPYTGAATPTATPSAGYPATNPSYAAPSASYAGANPSYAAPAGAPGWNPAYSSPSTAMPPANNTRLAPDPGYGSPAYGSPAAPVGTVPSGPQMAPPSYDLSAPPGPVAAATPGGPLTPTGNFPEVGVFDTFNQPTDGTIPLPMTVRVEETMTGRLMFGVGVNSDAGLMGNIVLDEQNFDWRRTPRSWDDIVSGKAWRGGGQRLRIEAVPGTEYQRYSFNFTEPYLLNTENSLGLSAFYYDRLFDQWKEQRLGAGVTIGRHLTKRLTGNLSFRAESINIRDPIDPTLPDFQQVLGTSDLYAFGASVSHDTRDSPFMATEGHLVQFNFEQVLGRFSYPRGGIEARQYFMLWERPDTSGRHVINLSGRYEVTGGGTPIYDRYYAGGFSTIRGFAFRGVSPRKNGVAVGGDSMALASAEYMFPITADDMIRGVVFCDSGTVQPAANRWTEDYRVAAGVGLRITIPAMGPAPIAFDFAFPLHQQQDDEDQIFSFFLGVLR